MQLTATGAWERSGRLGWGGGEKLTYLYYMWENLTLTQGWELY
jgi:hypothetical protein